MICTGNKNVQKIFFFYQQTLILMMMITMVTNFFLQTEINYVEIKVIFFI